MAAGAAALPGRNLVPLPHILHHLRALVVDFLDRDGWPVLVPCFAVFDEESAKKNRLDDVDEVDVSPCFPSKSSAFTAS